jgi:hypothetical protein
MACVHVRISLPTDHSRPLHDSVASEGGVVPVPSRNYGFYGIADRARRWDAAPWNLGANTPGRRDAVP